MMKAFNPLFRLFLILVVVLPVHPEMALSQLQRERVVEDRQIDRIFWTPQNVGLNTVDMIPAKNLNSTVLHTFGLVNGGIDRFFGLDDGANTRLGIEYGVSDRFSIGIGRMTFQKVVDIRSKIKILHQTESGSIPFNMVAHFATGITTVSGQNLDLNDRLSFLGALMIGKKMNRVSFQISPMFARFNNPIGTNPNHLFGVGLLTLFELNDRFALSAEYLPLFGDRFNNTTDAMGVALNIDTGGHVFQIFFTSSQFHNEQFIMSSNRDRFWEGDFRFGFNIHRFFGFGN